MPRQEQKFTHPQSQNLHVSTAEIHRVYTQQGNLPQRHKTRKCSYFRIKHQTRRFRFLQRYYFIYRGIYSKQPYTEYISTRWYRAPECLMTDGYYDSKMDIWGYGCVLFEMIAKYPLFNGKGELDQIHKINKVLGTPKQSLIELFKSRATHMSANDFNFPQRKGIGF